MHCEVKSADACNVRVASLAEIQSSRDLWNGLVSRMAFATPFVSWEWSVAWLRHFSDQYDPWVLYLRRGEQLLGILPLARRRMSRGVGARIELLGVPRVGADQMDLISSPENVEPCVDAASRFLREHNSAWSEINLQLVWPSSGLGAVAARLDRAERIHSEQVTLAPHIPVSGSFEDFLMTLSGNERYKLRTRTKKLLGMPGVEYCRVDPQEVPAAFDRLVALHRKRFQEKDGASSFAQDDVEAFHRTVLATMPPESVAMRGLRHDGEYFALFYGFRCHRRLFYFQLGYDPAWSAKSPGLVLLTQTIREAFDDGCVEYNFLQGEEAFKNTWTTQARPLLGVRVYSSGIGGVLLRAHRQTKLAAKRCLSALRTTRKPVFVAAQRDSSD